jgi:dTDP-4-amino-4,6-dideoxygalactose transaminase
VAGLNYRLTDFQGALGVVQMGRLESILASRERLAALYQHVLRDIPGIVCPVRLANTRHVWQSYVIRCERVARGSVQQALRDAGIETTIGTHAVSRQPGYAKYHLELANARCAYEQCLTLPLHPGLTSAHIEQIAAIVARVVQNHG